MRERLGRKTRKQSSDGRSYGGDGDTAVMKRRRCRSDGCDRATAVTERLQWRAAQSRPVGSADALNAAALPQLCSPIVACCFVFAGRGGPVAGGGSPSRVQGPVTGCGSRVTGCGDAVAWCGGSVARCPVTRWRRCGSQVTGCGGPVAWRGGSVACLTGPVTDCGGPVMATHWVRR